MSWANPKLYSWPNRYRDFKNYLKVRRLKIDKEAFENLTAFSTDSKDYRDYKAIFKYNFSGSFTYKNYKALRRKKIKGYTYEDYINDNKIVFKLDRIKYRDIEISILEGLRDILLNDNKVSFPYGLERIQLNKVQRDFSKPAINWNASNKRKEELLAQGKTLAKNTGHDMFNNPIFSEGERWLIYFLDDYYPVYNTYKLSKFNTATKHMHRHYALYDFSLLQNITRETRRRIREGIIDVSKLDLIWYQKKDYRSKRWEIND